VQEDVKAEPWHYLASSRLALETGLWDTGTHPVDASVMLGWVRMGQSSIPSIFKTDQIREKIFLKQLLLLFSCRHFLP